MELKVKIEKTKEAEVLEQVSNDTEDKIPAEQLKDKLKEKFGEETGASLLVALWLLKKYEVPYIRGSEDEVVLHRDGTIKLLEDVLRDTIAFDRAKMKNIYYSFVDFAIREGIFDEKNNCIAKEYIKCCEDIASEMDVVIPARFTSYLSDCTDFDRGEADAAFKYIRPMLKLEKDIETTGIFDLRSSDAYWSLLCAIASAMDDTDDTFDDESDDAKSIKNTLEELYEGKKYFGLEDPKIAQIAEFHIMKALGIRKKILENNDPENYFESASYFKELNNIAYTLLHVDKSPDTGKPFGYYEHMIRDFYDILRAHMDNAINSDLWKGLVVSNFGAVEAMYGSRTDALRYDEEAIAIKEAYATKQKQLNLIVEDDTQLTIIKSHLNIVNNGMGAIFEITPIIELNSNKVTDINEEKERRITEYVMLIGIHAIQALMLRNKIDGENASPKRERIAGEIKGNLTRLHKFLEEIKQRELVTYVEGITVAAESIFPECKDLEFDGTYQKFDVPHTRYNKK